MVKGFGAMGSAGVAGLLMCTAAFAAQVELRSPDGATAISGKLVAMDAAQYVLMTNAGEVRVNRADVECSGAACPKTERVSADLTVRGSDTIGDELMPLLIEGYAGGMGAAIEGQVAVGPDTVAMTVNGNDGFGEEVMVAMVQAAGSSTGLKALINRQTDIAMSSRPARGSEVQAIARQGRGNLLDLSQEYIIAVDSILAIVSPDNPVDALSMDQLAQIFAGRISNWAQVGGPDMPITVVTRPRTSGTRGVFERAVLAPAALSMSSDAVVLGSNDEITNLVAKTPGAIGYAGYAYKNATKGLDLVSGCGIPMTATAFSAKTEEYPLQRRLRLFVDNGRLSPEAQGLLDFAISPDADPFVRKAGFIDLSVKTDPDALDAQQVMAMAAVGGEPSAFDSAEAMLAELRGAARLSTTFRFLSGSSQLDNKSLRDLSRMVEFLEQPENKGREVIVAGYTDSVGDFAFNRSLSQQRAETVAGALAAEARRRGLNELRLRPVGYSELSPVGCNDTGQGKSRNRRVELWIR